MNTALVVAASVVAVVLAALGGLSTALRRRIGSAHLATAGLLEVLLVVQAVLAGMLMSFAVYTGAVVWVFAVRSARRAWTGLLCVATPLMAAACSVWFAPPLR